MITLFSWRDDMFLLIVIARINLHKYTELMKMKVIKLKVTDLNLLPLFILFSYNDKKRYTHTLI